VKKWKQATSYVERYMAKLEEFPKGLQTGRIWAVWNEQLLPVRWETVEVSLEDTFRIRRIYRRLARRKGSGSLRCITMFVRHENVVRLLEFEGRKVLFCSREGGYVEPVRTTRRLGFFDEFVDRAPTALGRDDATSELSLPSLSLQHLG
jgi:hypothetical protein